MADPPRDEGGASPVGSAKDGSPEAFIPDANDLDTVIRGTSASGIAVDDQGSVFAADVGAHNLRKYVKVGKP